jgi:hypothetical protein
MMALPQRAQTLSSLEAFMPRMLFTLLAVIYLVPSIATAGPVDDLEKVWAAVGAQKSWHQAIALPGGKTDTIDYVAPDRWRMQHDGVTTVVIGDSTYLIKNGKTEKLDIPAEGGPTMSFAGELGDDIKRSARDLGMQTLNGQAVHAYSFTSEGLPTTLYVGANKLPVQGVVHQPQGTSVTITFSQWNAPIHIEP